MDISRPCRDIRRHAPQTLVQGDEDTRVDALLQELEDDLDKALLSAMARAYIVGGTFRGPGIQKRIKDLLVHKIGEMGERL